MEKLKKAGMIVLWIFAAFFICLLAVNLYEFTTENAPALYIDNERSQITEVICTGDTIHYTASLCIRNRRPSCSEMDRLELYIYGRDGDEEHRDIVSAEITSPPYEGAIVFLPFWSRRIECTFDITDFGAAFNIGRIKYIETYPYYQ